MIWPDTTKLWPDTTKLWPDTTKCDRDALLAVADEMENNTWYETGFDHHIAVRFARRIREALEVER